MLLRRRRLREQPPAEPEGEEEVEEGEGAEPRAPVRPRPEGEQRLEHSADRPRDEGDAAPGFYEAEEAARDEEESELGGELLRRSRRGQHESSPAHSRFLLIQILQNCAT